MTDGGGSSGKNESEGENLALEDRASTDTCIRRSDVVFMAMRIAQNRGPMQTFFATFRSAERGARPRPLPAGAPPRVGPAPAPRLTRRSHPVATGAPAGSRLGVLERPKPVTDRRFGRSQSRAGGEQGPLASPQPSGLAAARRWRRPTPRRAAEPGAGNGPVSAQGASYLSPGRARRALSLAARPVRTP